MGKIINLLIFLILISFLLSCGFTRRVNKNELMKSWQISRIDLDFFNLPNRCDKIRVGDILIFRPNSLTIKKSDNEFCNSISYKINKNKSVVFVDDMILNYTIKSLSHKKLILLCHNLPDEMRINWKNEYSEFMSNGFKIELILSPQPSYPSYP